MKEAEFKGRMAYAETMLQVDERPEYWKGYIRGLHRRYKSKDFVPEDEHASLMNMIFEHDEKISQGGRGYRDALSEEPSHMHVCQRCRNEWRSRGSGKSTICPKCKTPYWDKPRREKG
jgi:predicted Zn-ribbon and HTH transcriptional regulator